MTAWRTSTWGDEVTLEYGKALRGYEVATGPVRVFGSNGPVGWTDKALSSGPGVILGRKGAYRGVQYSEEDFFVIDTAYYVVPKHDLDMRWLYYAIQYHKLGEIDDGSPVPSTTRAAVYVRDLEVPPKEMQVEMARVLGAIDDKIALNRRINQTLEAMAQAIFKSWFVDFDPVKAKIAAKAEGRDPLRAAMTAISGKPDAELDTLPPDQFAPLAATTALFPDEMEASALGEIPKGWAYVAAESLSDVGIGKTPPRKEPQWFTEESGDWRWVSIKDMGAGTLYQQLSSEYLTKEAVSRFNVRVVPDNTVLLSFKLTVGRVAISDGELLTNEAIAHFKLSSDPVVSSEYLYLYLKGFDFSSLGSTSSIADAVNSKTIRDLPVLLPSKELVARLGEAIRPMLQEIRSRQSEVRTLTETRDALLPKLLSGELQVQNTEAEAAA